MLILKNENFNNLNDLTAALINITSTNDTNGDNGDDCLSDETLARLNDYRVEHNDVNATVDDMDYDYYLNCWQKEKPNTYGFIAEVLDKRIYGPEIVDYKYELLEINNSYLLVLAIIEDY